MTDIDPYVLGYTADQAAAIEAQQQALVDAYNSTPKTDPLDEVLRLANLTQGANATLDPQSITDPEVVVNLKRLEIARQAAYIAGLPKSLDK